MKNFFITLIMATTLTAQHTLGQQPLFLQLSEEQMEELRSAVLEENELSIHHLMGIDPKSFMDAVVRKDFELMRRILGLPTKREFLDAARSGDTDTVRYILRNGLIDVNTRDIMDSGTALMSAAARNRSETLDALIEFGAILDIQNNDGYTALTWAARNGRNRIVDDLIAAGADVNATNGRTTPLIEAARYGFGKVVSALIKAGASLDAKGIYGRTALSWAAMNRHDDIMDDLIVAGADVNVDAPLIEVAMNGSDTKIMSAMIAAGAVIDAQNHNGYTPLIWAAWNGNDKIVSMLLAHGADVNFTTDFGGTALRGAAQNGHGGIVSMLLSHGADVNARAIDTEYTALILAAWNGHDEIVDDLINFGALLDAQDNLGNTALIRAARSGHGKAVDILLAAGAKVDIRDRDGDTALFLAILGMHNEIVPVLLAHGADVNVRNDVNNTPLIRVAKTNFNTILPRRASIADFSQAEELLSILVTAGADVNAENDNGETALTWARKAR